MRSRPNFLVNSTGNIFDFAADACEDESKIALVCPVNCVAGVMGRGLAKDFAQRWPRLQECHKYGVESGSLAIGNPHVAFGDDDGLPMQTILFPTKDHWRYRSRFAWIVAGLIGMSVLRTIGRASHVETFVFPAIGCGLGGLEWGPVRDAIEGFAIRHPEVNVVVYEPIYQPERKFR